MITKGKLNNTRTYLQYVEEIKTLLEQGKSTGNVQTDEYLEYSKINLHRMQRLDKTVELTDKFKSLLDKIPGRYYLIIISEGWCGDSAQLLPLFGAIERYNPKFQVKIFLRDEHPDVMDQYLTNGSRSIPKVICVAADSLDEHFTWGPRPAELQSQVLPMIRNSAPKSEKSIFIQKWYNDDKTLSTQKELIALFGKLQHAA
jgi:hypothetical protein